MTKAEAEEILNSHEDLVLRLGLTGRVTGFYTALTGEQLLKNSRNWRVEAAKIILDFECGNRLNFATAAAAALADGARLRIDSTITRVLLGLGDNE